MSVANLLREKCTDEELARLNAAIDGMPGVQQAIEQLMSPGPLTMQELQANLPGLPPPPKDSVAAQLRKAKAQANRDKWEVPMMIQVRAIGLPEPIRNFRFAADHLGWDADAKRSKAAPKFGAMLLKAGLKDWKFDLAWPEHRIAVEIEGAPGHGRHTTAGGFTDDCVKYGEATVRGWTVIRVSGAQVKSGYAVNLTYRFFKSRGIILSSAV